MDQSSDSPTGRAPTAVDAVVVGAGFAGLYMLHRLREMGLSVQGYETGSSVGGTWYWNRYPGARCDTRSLGYSFSFDEQLWRDWDWTEDYAAQPEIERYMNYVADRLDLRREIRFDTRVTSAVWNDDEAVWLVETDQGDAVVAKYCFLATGGFSAPIVPNIAGLDSFSGEVYYTNQWPAEPVDFQGRRVGVIGTGSSGMQTITAIGQEDAFETLHVFQRTANFAVPGQNKPLTAEYQQDVKDHFEDFWAAIKSSGSGFAIDVPVGPAQDLSEEEFTRRMDESFAVGGPAAMGWVTDMLTSEQANARVADYLRAKVRERVADPATAELLIAKGFYVGSRRQLIENGYFEVYNNPKVTLVDVKADPIARVTPTGLQTESGRSFDLDVLILATGFDSGSGAVLRIGLTGREGRRIADHWAQGPQTYLGVMTAGFPNCFMIAGVGSPSIRSVVTVSIEQHVEWLGRLLEHASAVGASTIDVSAEAEAAWTSHVADTANRLLLSKDDTQYFGSNVPGKPRVYLAYVGGVQAYKATCEQVAANDYEGFVFEKENVSVTTNAREWSGPPAPTPTGGSSVSEIGSAVI